MRAASLIALLAAVPALAQTPAAAPQQPGQPTQQTAPAAQTAPLQDSAQLTTRVRFSDRLAIRAAPATEDKAAPRVDIRHWSIPEQHRIGDLKIAGFDTTPGKSVVIYNLRAGVLITVINGKRIERRVGEFWTLRAGQRQVLETGNDTAVIETIVVEQP